MSAQTRARGRRGRGGRGSQVPYARKTRSTPNVGKNDNNSSVSEQQVLLDIQTEIPTNFPLPGYAPTISDNSGSSGFDAQPDQGTSGVSGSEFMNIKILSSLIPGFNGEKSKLFKFISQCRRAEKYCSPRDLRSLIEIINSKLEGEAARVLQRVSNIDSGADIITAIKTHFTPSMDIGLAQAELIKLNQNTGEKVRMFGLRMAEKLDLGVESAKEFYNEQQFIGVKVSLERTAIRAFINGLSNAMEKQFITFFEPDTLNKAIEIAEKSERNRETAKLFAPQSVPTTIQVNHVQAKKQIECYACHNLGHIARNCPKKREERNKLHCNYCNKKGHVEEKCFSKFPELRARKTKSNLSAIQENAKNSLNSAPAQNKPND